MSGSNARSAPQQREGAPKTKKEGLACSLANSAKQSLDKVKDYKKKKRVLQLRPRFTPAGVFLNALYPVASSGHCLVLQKNGTHDLAVVRRSGTSKRGGAQLDQVQLKDYSFLSSRRAVQAASLCSGCTSSGSETCPTNVGSPCFTTDELRAWCDSRLLVPQGFAFGLSKRQRGSLGCEQLVSLFGGEPRSK